MFYRDVQFPSANREADNPTISVILFKNPLSHATLRQPLPHVNEYSTTEIRNTLI